ncbi:MAG: GHMP kinase [Elusimicrobia bacterium]|nr:GHMP kinase [Elusimicrobiota bacterium]
MIISRTPFRVSFAGGGTDLADFYRSSSGAVVSTAIDKYMYITVNRYFDDSIILKYSKTELVKSVDEVQHPLLRECLRKTGIKRGIEITSMADVVGGTGLGSSSAFTVGVLHALYAHLGQFKTPEQLAREACEIEIERLKEPIGKQDQYISAYGGFQFLEFMPDETVRVDPLICPVRTIDNLHEHLMLLYSGVTRKAGPLLRRAKANFKKNDDVLKLLRAQANRLRASLQKGDVASAGPLLHEAWEAKKSLAGGITSPHIDDAYDAARRAGAIGGKVLGAGGGGFLLVFVPPAKRAAVAKRLPSGWREMPFRFESEGSKIIYVSK